MLSFYVLHTKGVNLSCKRDEAGKTETRKIYYFQSSKRIDKEVQREQ